MTAEQKTDKVGEEPSGEQEARQERMTSCSAQAGEKKATRARNS